ncbi:MAG: DUF262 domain-containing protein [Candidatus Micrarchaeaceae archaeon]
MLKSEIISTAKLVKLPFEIPNYQRGINEDKVEEIYNFLINDTNKIIGTFTVCKFNGKYHLIDGQHRYKAVKKYMENIGSAFEVNVLYCNVNSEKEIWNTFQNLNKCEPMPSHNIDNNIDKYREYKLLLINNNFPIKNVILGKINRDTRPVLSTDQFVEAIYKRFEFVSTEKFKDFILKLNDEIKNKIDNNDEIFIKKYKISNSMIDKAKNLNNYIGLISHMDYDKLMKNLNVENNNIYIS